ncbi:NUDIX hydrolase [Paenibacillus mendelii]|uniref:NUDIX domain-containing protein n=1 Tax=Paenibacillus mendelii TaxID=206163 RepID=A0ABV6JCX9_9BACL|nr:NUDIX domain-containing protein [Paenibacillus mendelii]MCQ6562480.1 NUDIX domain-containing protein [Paenibacillus mendelii]
MGLTRSEEGDEQEERFDIYDEAETWIGTAARSTVHAMGYWHRSFHCWLIRQDGGRKLVLFQQRSANKDTFPLHYDITAAGHLAAGETMQDASREVEEELGVGVQYESLLPLGEARHEAVGTAKGVPFIDREISSVHGFVYEGTLSALQLQAEEVAGVYEADLDDMIALFENRLAYVTASGMEYGSGGRLQETERIVYASDFVTRPASYYAGVFRALLNHIVS